MRLHKVNTRWACPLNEQMIVFKQIGYGGSGRASYACDPNLSRGRFIAEAESPTRTCFQRDRDRIVHSTAFRRLNHKTQVFFSHDSDHYRTRLTHTMEVAQIARAFSRAFRLDEDLAEAIALVHDFGHTPFGHTGEDRLDALMAPYGGFDHNVQALRVVTKLEQAYAEFDGLNLTWESLEGLAKHNGPIVGADGLPLTGKMLNQTLIDYDAKHSLALKRYASLEAQVAAIADDVAYNTHDIDDGLRAGLLTLEMLRDVNFVDAIIDQVDALYPALEENRRGHEVKRRVMTVMVEDVIAQTLTNLETLTPSNADDVRGAGRQLVHFSAAMADNEKQLKAFLFSNMYRHENVMRLRAQAEDVVTDLFKHFMTSPADMGMRWSDQITVLDEPQRALRVADYIAGMTDSYALMQHRRWFDHTPELR